MTEEDKSTRRRPRVAPAVERQIDENLKRLYRQQLEDDLPDSLKSLVAKLRGQGADVDGSAESGQPR